MQRCGDGSNFDAQDLRNAPVVEIRVITQEEHEALAFGSAAISAASSARSSCGALPFALGAVGCIWASRA